jgi:hypothetical protein
MSFWQGWTPESDHPWAAHYRTKIHVPTTTTTLQLANGFGTVLALIVEETTGSAGARFELWDGTSTGGEYIGPWTLSSGQSIDNAYPPKGLVFRNGLFLNVTAGSVAGSVLIGTLVPWPMVHNE